MQVRQGGMTLLEVVLAMAVLALGMFASAALQVRGQQASDDARRQGTALQLTQGLLEQVRAAGSLTLADQAAWQAQVALRMGRVAQGHLGLSAGVLTVELRWPGVEREQILRLQGRVQP
ncbi:MAG: prepilin-type N-terminal cleavage/methylation domain-containing protein [Paucimonas sp.]|jgi:type IV pilus assembly protein PilV|uniref:type IV pilus modification PilV family protein n=1 Tax=Pantoea sp. Cy-639 TaxID=2608360 RepID=UPI0019640E41|nr:prepilin-type N-terminal cleavage/methylation domain-containing protein [Pantoea sp. Cy-639]MDR2306287.1 prepilin-type N-terminal cleavage/methylation domain-containing protein [Paucimonas sp.]